MFEALGLNQLVAPCPWPPTPPAGATLPGSPYSASANAVGSPAWAAYLQAASLAAATLAMSGQLGAHSQAYGQCDNGHAAACGMPSWEAHAQWPASSSLMAGPPAWDAGASVDPSLQMGAQASMYGGLLATGHSLTSPTATSPQMVDAVAALEDTPSRPATPLVLPDVLPAESRHSGSSSSGAGSDVVADKADAGPWPPASATAAAPSEWPSSMPWLAAGDAPSMSTCSLGAEQWMTEDATTASRNNAVDPVPILELNKISLLPPESATPPPKTSTSRWALRVDAPCFVPQEVSAGASAITPAAGGEPQASMTPEKVTLANSDFITSRAQMLQLRPADSPQRKLSAAGLKAATEAFEASKGVAASPAPKAPAAFTEASPAQRCLAELFGTEKKSSEVKAESRAQIRALAASARAQLAQAAAEKDSGSTTATSRSSRRSRRSGGAGY